ncbi:hypothetical protein [Algoriphagus chordae]|uniref:Uncharacterized protein n=1 Tax=Algoriphagus chordae TaxID=237019 RepID=A0A2W7RM20_9BACT|nr:hypothetical protein [Algoriphagus chordae]PZX55569.1 hypothetical protein LV85_00794 [Algoriphagus chordae]
MKYIFRVIEEGNPTQLEIGQDVLDVLIKISSYINTDFVASDFFTLGNTSHHALTQFLELLQDAQGQMKLENNKVLLTLKRDRFDKFDRDQYHLLKNVLWYGSNFGDDIPELESLHDDIYNMYGEIFP